MNEQIVGAQRKILREQVFRTGTGLLAIGSCHTRIRSEERWSNAGDRCNKWPALCCREKAGCCVFIQYLLECLCTVFLDGSRQIGENVAVEETSIPRTKNPFRRRTPSETNSRADVIRVLIEPGRQAFKIVTHAQVNCQLAGERRMVLHESADTRRRKIHVRVPERLPKLTTIPRAELTQIATEVHAV